MRFFLFFSLKAPIAPRVFFQKKKQKNAQVCEARLQSTGKGAFLSAPRRRKSRNGPFKGPLPSTLFGSSDKKRSKTNPKGAFYKPRPEKGAYRQNAFGATGDYATGVFRSRIRDFSRFTRAATRKAKKRGGFVFPRNSPGTRTRDLRLKTDRQTACAPRALIAPRNLTVFECAVKIWLLKSAIFSLKHNFYEKSIFSGHPSVARLAAASNRNGPQFFHFQRPQIAIGN